MSLRATDSEDVTKTENALHDDHQLVVQHNLVEFETTTSPALKKLAEGEKEEEESGGGGCRDRLRRHRKEVAGRVWIPEVWGQEELLKDWVDCSVFDTALAPAGIVSARKALAEEGRLRRAKYSGGGGFRIENRC